MRSKRLMGRSVWVAVLLAAALAVPVGAISYISNYQWVLVGASSAATLSALIYYDYSTGLTYYDAGYGNYFSAYSLPADKWLGVFLYDYDTYAWQDFLYLYLQDV